MSNPSPDDEKALDPAAQRIVDKVRWLMLLSGFTGLFSLGHAAFLGVGAYTQAALTNVGVPAPIALALAALISAVIFAIGYRLFRAEGSGVTEIIALLPKGSKIVSIIPAADRIVVTLDVAGATEIRTFDLRTLTPAGRLRFANEP